MEGFQGRRPSVVYASSTPPTVGLAGLIVARLRGVRFFFEAVDVWPDVPDGMGLVRSRTALRPAYALSNLLYRTARRTITLSEGMRSQILGHGAAPSRVLVVHNGARFAQFAGARAGRQCMLDKPVRLIYAGAAGRVNGLEALLSAAEALRPYRWICFELYVWGSEVERLQEIARRLHLSRLVFHPPIAKDAVADVLARADVGVACVAPFPVLEANSANKFFDYLAAGLPVCINYEGWQAVYLRAYGCGLASTMGNETAFARNLYRLATDAALRRSMGEAGVRLAARAFDRDLQARKLLALMCNAASE